MQQNFEIIKMENPKVVNFLEQAFFVEKCQFNSAKIYKLKTESFLIIPHTLGKYVILYHDKTELDRHINNQYFPIKDFELNEILECEKRNIYNIGSHIKEYLDYVEEKFDLCNISSVASIEFHLKSLNEKVNIYGLNKLTDYEILAIGLYVNEIFRLDTKTSWNIDLILTLNTYWYPNLISKKGIKYDILGKIQHSLIEDNYLNLVFLYKTEKARYRGYKPFSKEYMNYISNSSPAGS